MSFDHLDPVTLAVDLPDKGLAAGAVGTVVHVFHKPTAAYEVEFVDTDGRDGRHDRPDG